MSNLAIELRAIGIPFNKDGNQIRYVIFTLLVVLPEASNQCYRCFPHVINIVVKAGLKVLTQDQDNTLFNNFEDYYDNEFMYGEFGSPLQDIVGSIRRYVTACRSSGQCREQFEAILKEGNKAGGWGNTNEQLRNMGLLKDVDTRWSATFNMLDRFLETYLMSRKLIETNDDLAHYAFDDLEIKVASNIRQFLYVFHVVQELVSAETTPTLSIVLPVYEKLITMLKMLCKSLPELVHGINTSITKPDKYLTILRVNKVYGLAMGT
ncbi:hypothetical protein B0H34DRAFT_656656 [Crassisporium funariophilum]|nr:hypothetical protein B0H34DRAFT_656656 [Crassisporium funariophilum]